MKKIFQQLKYYILPFRGIGILLLLLSFKGAAQTPMGDADYSVRNRMSIGTPVKKWTNRAAYLEIGDSLNSKKALLLPRGNKDSVSNAIKGLLFYNLPDATIYQYNGVAWIPLTGGSKVDSVTFSPSTNVDTVKYWIGGTAYVAGVVDVKCGLISPGTVVHDSLLSFTVSPSIHRSCLDGIRYTTTLAHLTLSAAHATLDRFDIIALEGSSVVVVEGDPSATPALPQLTPGQTYLTFISIPATATVPEGVSTATIYDENTEFTVTSAGITTNANNTTNVHHFLKSVDAGSFGLLSEVYFTGADFKISNYTSLRFFIKLKSAFANNTRLSISWLRDGVAQSSSVVLANNTYGYVRTNTSTYQEIIIPISDFSFSQDTVDALRIKFSGTNANGFYFDWATLTGGIPQTAPQANSFGVVQTQSGAAVSTQPNDVLNIVGAGGITTSAVGKTVTVTGSGGGGSQTLQQVFNTEVGGSVMTKSDTINLNGFNLKLFGNAGNSINYTSTGLFIAQNSTATVALYGVSTSSGIGVAGQSETGMAGSFFNNNSSTSTSATIVQLERATSGTAANGIGISVDMLVETVGGSTTASNKIVSSLPNATLSTKTSRFDIVGVSKAVTDTVMSLGGYVDLTESSATKFTSTTIATGKIQGGQILVTVEANDATDYQSRTLRFIWSAVNKAGTLTITIGTPEEVVALSSGTLTATITGVDAGSGVLDFKIDAASSLTQSTLRATYQKFKNF